MAERMDSIESRSEGSQFESLVPLKIPAGWHIGRNLLFNHPSYPARDPKFDDVAWDPEFDDVEVLNVSLSEEVMVALGITQSIRSAARYWVTTTYIHPDKPFHEHFWRELVMSEAIRVFENAVHKLTENRDAFRR